MRNLALAIFGLASLLAGANPVIAAEWPSTRLGPADTSFRTLRIGVYYYGAVLHDLPDEQGAYPLPLADADQSAAGFDISSIGNADPAAAASEQPQPATAEAWLELMAALPELTPEAMEGEYQRVRFELDEAARFYWRNSRFNCALDYEWIPSFTPCLRSTIAAADAPYYSPVDHPAYADARERYDGLLQIMVLYVFDKQTQQLKRVKGGGGFTWGADGAKHLCGWSWWAACSADNVCGSDWLTVHEFGHQLDSVFDQSGHPEFWFNHLALSEGNVARFGEHFDANAFILRRVPERDWLDLQWGELRSYQDADRDTVPDSELYLAELGLLTDPDPAAPDSDGDGLLDFEEYMASNGNRLGHGDRLFPALKPCDPLDRDSDSDGVPDGADLLPGWPAPDSIPGLSQNAPGAPLQVLMTNTPEGLDFGVGLSYCPDLWSDEDGTLTYGYFTIDVYWGRSSTQVVEDSVPAYSAKIMLDLQNNGWFAGDDNYRIELDSSGVQRVVHCLAASATEWPRDELADSVKDGIRITQISPIATYAHGVSLQLKRDQLPELVTKPGTVLGINVGIKRAKEPWYYMLADPNTLLPLELR